MASRFVACKDREEALAMLDAGLLWLNWGAGIPGRVVPAEEKHRWVVERYLSDETTRWEAGDFTYLVEEDTESTQCEESVAHSERSERGA